MILLGAHHFYRLRRRIAIIVLGNPQRPFVHLYIDRVVAAVNAAARGSYVEVEIPFE